MFAIVRKSGCDLMNFEVNLIFLIKPFFLHDQNKFHDKNFTMKYKAFFIIFKGISIKEITNVFGRWESEFKPEKSVKYIRWSYFAKIINCWEPLTNFAKFIHGVSNTLLGWLKHLVGRFACYTRMILDASSSPPVSHVK